MSWFTSLFKKQDIKSPLNISEPVYSMLNAWKEDKDRFEFNFQSKFTGKDNFTLNDIRVLNCKITDSVTKELFEFVALLKETRHSYYIDAYPYYIDFACQWKPRFAANKVCLCDGADIYSTPSWMTLDEVEFLKAEMFPYYQKRIARYRDILKYREQRRKKASERNSQIAKEKERNRLVEIYK